MIFIDRQQQHRANFFARILTVVLCWAIYPDCITAAVAWQLEEPASSTQSDSATESDDLNKRFNLILVIGEAEANALRRDGILKTEVPARYRNRVGSILLKGPTTFLNKRLTVEEDIDKHGQDLLVNVDESIVDRLGYQPVLMKVYQSGFTTVVLRYQRGGPKNRLASNRESLKPKPADSPQMFIRLSDANGTSGWIRDLKTLAVLTEFGSVEIPMSKVKGVRFNTGGKDDVVVITATGDYVTGKIAMPNITLATRWGEETIGIEDIESVTWHRNSRFSKPAESDKSDSSKSSEKRWLLSPAPQPKRSPQQFPVYNNR